MEKKIASPLGGNDTKLLRRLSGEFLRKELSQYFDRPYPKDGTILDYEIWRCEATGLEFAHPMEPGDQTFYDWIVGADFYYPSDRWEYRQVIDDLNRTKPASLIDVGCGDGRFLLQVGRETSGTAVAGLDMLEKSIVECRKQGLTAYCGTIDEVLEASPELEHSFDVVTSFHCLEHVPSPVDFVAGLLRLKSPAGALVVSTPLSPMTFEALWFDVQNHPPHHMTRWTPAAYRRLASSLGLEVSFAFAPAVRYPGALYQAIKMQMVGANVAIKRSAVLGKMLRRPFFYLGEIIAFTRAWLRAEQRGSNGVMAIFRHVGGQRN